MKKLLLGLGTLASVAAPVAAVIACGSDSNTATFKEADVKYQTAVTKLAAAIATADANADIDDFNTAEVKGDQYRLTFITTDTGRQSRYTVDVKKGTLISLETKMDADSEFIVNPDPSSKDAIETAAKTAGDDIAAIDAKPVAPAAGNNPTNTGTGAGTAAVQKFTYKGNEYDSEAEAETALKADSTPASVWKIDGKQFDTEDEARDEFLHSTAGQALIETEGAKVYYVYDNKVYSTEQLAAAEFIKDEPTKTKGVDTITLATKTGGIGVATLTTSTEEVERESDTALSLALATAKVTLGAPVKSGTNGVAGVTGKTVVEQVQDFLTANTAENNAATVEMATGKEYFFKDKVDGAGYIQASDHVTAAELTAAGYTDAAKDIADLTKNPNMVPDQATTADGVIYTEKGLKYYFSSMDDFIGAYNGIASHTKHLDTTPTVKTAVTGISNSEITTSDVLYGGTTIGKVVVKSPEYRTEAPTSTIPTATVADSLTIKVAETTAWAANAAKDAGSKIAPTSYEGTKPATEGVTVTASGLTPAAAGSTKYKVDGKEVADVASANAAVKALAKPVKAESSTKIIIDGVTYNNEDAAKAALIK